MQLHSLYWLCWNLVYYPFLSNYLLIFRNFSKYLYSYIFQFSPLAMQGTSVSLAFYLLTRSIFWIFLSHLYLISGVRFPWKQTADPIHIQGLLQCSAGNYRHSIDRLDIRLLYLIRLVISWTCQFDWSMLLSEHSKTSDRIWHHADRSNLSSFACPQQCTRLESHYTGFIDACISAHHCPYYVVWKNIKECANMDRNLCDIKCRLFSSKKGRKPYCCVKGM